jgi:hypothetical protein
MTRYERGDRMRAPDFAHAWPQEIVAAFCVSCDRLVFARHVNRENEVPPRYCSHCARLLSVALYRFNRSVPG